MDFLVACGDPAFRFDPAWLRESAPARWPRVEFVEPYGALAGRLEFDVLVIGADGTPDSDAAVHPGGEAVGLECRTEEAAADVLAWLASAPGLPQDGSVLVVHWQDDVYPLLPGATTERLLADYQV